MDQCLDWILLSDHGITRRIWEDGFPGLNDSYPIGYKLTSCQHSHASSGWKLKTCFFRLRNNTSGSWAKMHEITAVLRQLIPDCGHMVCIQDKKETFTCTSPIISEDGTPWTWTLCEFFNSVWILEFELESSTLISFLLLFWNVVYRTRSKSNNVIERVID